MYFMLSSTEIKPTAHWLHPPFACCMERAHECWWPTMDWTDSVFSTELHWWRSSRKTVVVSSYGRFKDGSAKTRIICTTPYLCLDATKSMEHWFHMSQLPSIAAVSKIMHEVRQVFGFDYCSSRGLYKKTIRRVVDLRDYYYLVTEELGCDRCKKSFQSWDSRWEFITPTARKHYNSLLSLLIQLTESQVSLFPAILTYHLACDKAVVSLLRGRTLGNSPTALRNAVYEVHCEEWTRKQLRYLDDCRRYRWVWYLTKKS